MTRRFAPRDVTAQQAVDPRQKAEDAAERANAVQQLKGNDVAMQALVRGAVASGPVNQAAFMLDVGMASLREQGVPEAQGSEQGDGGKATLDPKEDPPADLGEVADRLSDMANNGVPPEDPEAEGGEGGGSPVMRSGDGGGDEINASEVRPLIEGSTAKPLPESVASRLSGVLDHPFEHVMLHIDGKAAQAADKVHADAFALGSHLFFAGGEYQPGTPGGDMLLMHELTHVAQYDHGQLRGSSSGEMEVSKPGETAEMEAEGAALAGLNALRAADQNKPEAQVLPDNVHPVGRGMRPENQPMKQFMREGVPQKGVIFREAAGNEAQDHRGGGVWSQKLALLHPELTGLGDEGAGISVRSFEREYGDALQLYVSERLSDLAPTGDLVLGASDVMDQLGEVMSLLAGAVSGDMACCERITELAGGLAEALEQWRSGEGALGQWRSEIEAFGVDLAEMADGFMQDMVGDAQAWLDSVGLQKALDFVQSIPIDKMQAVLDKYALGPAKNLAATVTEKGQAFAQAAMDVADDALDTVASVLAELPIVKVLAALGDVLQQAAEAGRWLYEHWGDETIWETESAQIEEQFGVLGTAMKAMHDGWTNVKGGLGAAGEALKGVQATCKELAESPWFGLAFTLPGMNIPALGVYLLGTANAETWSPLLDGASAAGSWLLATVQTLGEVTAVLLGLVGGPVTWVPLIGGLLGEAILKLPECYQVPIIDSIIRLLGAAVEVVTMPLLAFGVVPAAMHEAAAGIDDKLLALDDGKKRELLDNVSNLFRGGWFDEFMGGLGKGVLVGLWEELKGILMLIGALAAAIPAAITAGIAATLVMSQAIRDRAKEDSEEEGPTTDPPAPVKEPRRPQEVTIDTSGVDELKGGQSGGLSYTRIRELFGAALDTMAASIGDLADQALDAIMKALESVDEAAFKAGEWIGWAVAIIVAEVLLTKGAGAVAGVGAKLVKHIDKLDDAVRGVGKGLRSIATAARSMVDELVQAVDWFLDAIGGLGLPFADDLARKAAASRDELTTWADEMVEAAEELSKSPKKKPGKGKPGEGEEEEEADKGKARKVADRAFQKAAADQKKPLESERELTALLRKPNKLDKEAEKATLDFDDGTSMWELAVTSAYGKATSEAGWVGYSDKDQPYFGEESAAKTNKATGDVVFGALEDSWQAIFDDLDHDDEKKALAKLTESMKAEDLKHEKDLTYSNMQLELTTVGGVKRIGQQAEVRVELAISPNTFRDGRTLKADPDGRREQFEKVWPTVVDEGFAAELKEPWMAAVESAGRQPFDFSWPTHYHKQQGADAVKQRLMDWLLGNRRDSSNTWEDRLLAKLKDTEYRSPFMAPTVASAKSFLDAAIDTKGLKDSWSTEVTNGRLALQAGGGASAALKTAVKAKGIVGFLLAMAKGQTVHEVTAADFSNEQSPGPNSWFYEVNGPQNKAYVKSRFRSEGQARQGKHEWIPCAMIIEVVTKTQDDDDAEKGAQWLSLQDKLRSPTTDLVFRPDDAPDLIKTVAEYMTQSEGDLEALRTKLVEKETTLDDYGISGHVGALYLQVDGKRSAKVDKSPAFHAQLNGLFDFHDMDPKTYGAELAAEVADRDSDAALWDGDVKPILPEQFNDKPYAQLVPSSYEDKTGTSWGEDLWAFKEEAKQRQKSVIASLRSTKP